MAARSTMAALILRIRGLINDTLPAGSGQVFDDQTIQDVMDESRLDVLNGSMAAQPTFTGSTILYLDYFTEYGGWEDGMTLKQYLTIPVTPALIEPIAGHFQFAATTLPPVFITGHNFDIYRSAADLLERWAAQWALLFNVNVDGLSLQRSQAITALLNLAQRYRMKQRAGSLSLNRSDSNSGASAGNGGPTLAPNALDYFASGDGR